MNGGFISNFFFILLFLANNSFATPYYSQKRVTKKSTFESIGDLTFSYSKTLNDEYVHEIIEKEFTRVIIKRNSKNALMNIEQKTKLGFLYFSYQNTPTGWKISKVSFRHYVKYFKDRSNISCLPDPYKNNHLDVTDLKKKLELYTFGELLFDKNCSKNLSDDVYVSLVSALYFLLGDVEENIDYISNPKSVSCVKSRAADNSVKSEFIKIRNKIAIVNKNDSKLGEFKGDPTLPFPISCDFDGQKQEKCGILKEGIKSQIGLDVKCLPKDPQQLISKAQDIFMHELAHLVRQPKALTEEQINKFDRGICEYSEHNKVFATPNEVEISQQKLEKTLNSPNREYKTIPKEVINPYAAFNPASEVARPAATTASSSGVGAVARRSTASAAGLQASRVVASSGNTQINYNIPELNSFNLPESHYQATKQYVNNTMAAISKRIAPVVRAIESPAFAEDLQKATAAASGATLASGTGSFGGASEPSSAGSDFDSGTSSAPIGNPGSSSAEVAGAGGGGGSQGGSRIKAASAGRSDYLPNSPKTAAPAAGKSSSQEPDLGLDKAYALKIRRQLISDEEFQERLRKNGIYIQFSDGYLFKSPEKKIHYNESNGVLIREN